MIRLSAPAPLVLVVSLVALGTWWYTQKLPWWPLLCLAILAIFARLTNLVAVEHARLYPVVIAGSVFLAFYGRQRQPNGFLNEVVARFKKLDSRQRVTLQATEKLWLGVILLNFMVLTGFLFMGSWEAWTLYAGFLSYLLIGVAIVLTICIVHAQDWAIYLWNRVIHLLNFATFGGFCLIGLPLLYLVLAAAKLTGTSCQRFVRISCHHVFRYVRWQCHWTRFIDMEFNYTPGASRAPTLLLCNHRCLFDIVAIFGHFPECHTFVNQSFCKNPLLRPFIKLCGYIPIAKGSLASSVAGFERAGAILSRREQMVIFPEGTRSPSGQLGKLQAGGFRLALDTQTNITPVYFSFENPFLNKANLFKREPQAARLRANILPDISIDLYDNTRSGLGRLMADFTAVLEQFHGQNEDRALPGGHYA